MPTFPLVFFPGAGGRLGFWRPGGVDVTALGGEDWRPAYRAELADARLLCERASCHVRQFQLARTIRQVGIADGDGQTD